MKNLMLSILCTFAFVSIGYASDYDDYAELLNEYNDCVQTAQVFSGGPECIKPDEIPGWDSPVVYVDGVLHLNDIVIIGDDDVINISYVKMILVDGVFVITEIIE